MYVHTHSCSKGLNGKQAAWAAKRYHGHRTVSESYLTKYDEAK
jgi:hypothetical protein